MEIKKTDENGMEQTTLVVRIEREIALTQEDIDDIVCTALEGGITYWCYRAEVIGEYLGEYASDQISRGGTLKLYGEEEVDGETKWWLTREKFLNGFKLWVEDGADVYGAVQPDGTVDCFQLDAEMADMIIQYALFGEVVFG